MTRHVPPAEVRVIVDVGCGTGRFSVALAEAFDADVIGVDPSQTMLAAARGQIPNPRVDLRDGDAAHLPVADGSACLVYLSMVYHHLDDPRAAGEEFARVLRGDGFLCIRNSTLDLLDRYRYLRYFPAAVELNRRRLPSQRDVIETMRATGFCLLAHDVVEQRFADSFQEYYDKISRRGLSDLAALSDADFEAGLRTMEAARERSDDPRPVLEPIDLFIFRLSDVRRAP